MGNVKQWEEALERMEELHAQSVAAMKSIIAKINEKENI